MNTEEYKDQYREPTRRRRLPHQLRRRRLISQVVTRHQVITLADSVSATELAASP
jgi:hypothetical protein